MRKWSVVLAVFFALIFVSAARGQTGANNAELNGNYAFTFSGMSGNGNFASTFAAVGRFTADGAGNLTNGQLDTNAVSGGGAAQSFTGMYSIGADHRGTMTFNFSSSSAKLAFAMLANGNAQLIEFDASGGAGVIGSGTMEKSDSTAFSTARITGDYAFGAAGSDNANNRAAIEGRFTSNGTGTLSNAAGDLNGYGTDYAMTFSAARYAVSSAATGRGTMNFTFTFGGSPASLNFVFYVVNSAKLFVMESDQVSTATPLLNGVVVQQQAPTGGFTAASLNGDFVVSFTGRSQCGSLAGVPKAVVGLLTTNGSGGLSLTYDENFCSAPNSVTNAPGSYSMATNGRAAITIGGYSLVGYLVNSNQVFLFVSDSNVLFGTGERQTATSLTNSSLNGNYAGYATNPVGFGVNVFSGEFSANGVSPTGTMTGTEDIGTPSGPRSGVAFNATYSVSASPTNGRGTMSVSAGTGGNVVLYMVSPTKFVAISQSDPSPAVLDFEVAPSAAATATLSSLTLNPTTVTGGNSSTGTVTLSAAAPAGGATVALSSSNTNVARTPASVVIAAGATSATFTVATSAVTASTAVTISGTYGGVTRSASLTITPGAPPPPTLSSLTLNPTSVTGGNSSTGTVTLSAAAPAGGATVALSSNNTNVATTPASVVIAAGATSATFTVSTSAVGASTTVTISGTYSGVTRSASLTVTPAAPPPPTLSSLTLNPSSVTGGNSSTGTVTLSAAAPAGGATVALSSNNTNVARTPASVVIAAGATSATFTVSTSAVGASTTVTISGTYSGVTRSASLTVTPAAPPPPTLSSLTLNPTSVVGGFQSSTGTVTLSGAAPAGGATVALSSNNTNVAQTPSSVTVAAGATSATFTVTTSAVTFSTTVTISGTYGGVTRSASLTVTPVLVPLGLASLTLSPSSVVGGLQSSTGTVTLNRAASAGGAVITLSSSNGAASVPSSVVVPAGATSASFPVGTSIVLISTSSTITASLNDTSRSATLAVLL